MSRYLENAARMLEKAEKMADENGIDSGEYRVCVELAREYQRLAEIERGQAPAHFLAPGTPRDELQGYCPMSGQPLAPASAGGIRMTSDRPGGRGQGRSSVLNCNNGFCGFLSTGQPQCG
ncbi:MULTISPECIES: hypothetical protein [Pseudofrankia]|uniref:hypothetical protein n=1 Tax=Pseudofrankia TaxID=2994363 RepID=UPI0010420549|nr:MULTISPECIES: hypothetical protein [Pseudofrankia]